MVRTIDEYTPREMRLIRERDAALLRAETAESALADRDQQIAALRETIEAEVVEQVRDWVERSTRIAYNPYQQGYAAALLDVASGLRCGAWRKP